MGLKTGMYYLRSRSTADVIKFTVDTAALKFAIIAHNPLMKSIEGRIGRMERKVKGRKNLKIGSRGQVSCRTGVNVFIFSNKFPDVYTTTCLSPSNAVNARFINNSNVLAVSDKYISPDAAMEILEAWLNTRRTRGK
ncbi:hypothetical protein Fmac_025098 [Flemingia macrophylla]|uniref:Uncharacterized protein n=1 Tax=Flemingia macrophylla TaxID=520843 RepID=A0ABD1LR82_9FABA